MLIVESKSNRVIVDGVEILLRHVTNMGSSEVTARQTRSRGDDLFKVGQRFGRTEAFHEQMPATAKNLSVVRIELDGILICGQGFGDFTFRFQLRAATVIKRPSIVQAVPTSV